MLDDLYSMIQSNPVVIKDPTDSIQMMAIIKIRPVGYWVNIVEICRRGSNTLIMSFGMPVTNSTCIWKRSKVNRIG